MAQYILYNDDVRVAQFSVSKSVISEYFPEKPELLPMQIRHSTAEGFSSWLRERAVDLTSVQHRNLMNELLGSRDKTILALRTHMFSISDTFTCFEAGDFTPRLTVRLACGSESTRSTFSPALANPTPRLTVETVFPTPPF